MSEQKPSPVTYHEYDIPSLNSWFAWSAAALFVVSAWMVWADYEREWKDYQRRFTEVEIQRTKAAVAAADKAIDKKALEAAKGALAAAEKTVAAREADRSRVRAARLALEGTWYQADQNYKFAKAELDVARYEVDEARRHRHGLPEKQKAFDEVMTRVEKARLAFEQADGQMLALDGELAAIEKDLVAARKEIDRLTEERKRHETRLAKIDHSLFNDWFRNQPLVDFLAPSIVVKQAVLEDLHEDVNFLTVPRVDRCHSCHLATDQAGWTDAKLAPEFRSHPRLELLIGRNHPVDRFGCTGCHSGSGRAITFTDATHTPADRRDAAGKVTRPASEVAKQWEEKYHWHEVHHWDYPMLPAPYTEANCTNCHAQQTRVPGADKLNAGRAIIEEYGCFGCHKIDRPGYGELEKVGPSLANLQGKVSLEWTTKWLAHPKGFRPSTRMPRFWGNSNTAVATPAMNWPLRDQLEAAAVARYVLGHSRPYEGLAKPPAGLKGDAQRGRFLVENRGCRGCHVVGEGDTGQGRFNPDFGPDLNQVGSKLSVNWLYAWVKNPQAVWAGTRMPDLRLSEQEALDVATWLATLRNPDFDAQAAPDLSGVEARKLLEDVVFEYLRKETTTAEARTRLAAMDEAARQDYLGRKLIGRYGCFGCHEGIAGFEKAESIGTELTTWASKLITQLDFGFVDIPHSKHDWLRAKLTNPRGFDQGKAESKDPQDLLKMPNFEFTPAQVEALMTAVLGFQVDRVQPRGHRTLDAAQAKVEAGRRLYRRFNCQGCHVIDGQGGGLEKVLKGGKPYSPPVLVAEFKLPDGRTGKTEEGAKVQPDWLFEFLKAPTPIRPWLEVRMPSFGLTDAEATGLVEYFSFHARQPYPYTSVDRSQVTEALLGDGEALFKRYSCVSCHLPLEQAMAANPRAKVEEVVASLAPNLELSKRRLKYDWLFEWLKDPAMLQKDTKMPSGFFYLWNEETKAYDKVATDADHQIDSLRAYLQFHTRPIYEPSARAARP